MEKPKALENLSVDCAIFGFQDKNLKVLLIRRTNAFMKSSWALPGHNVYEMESAEDAARRILYEMSGVSDIYLDQVSAFSDVNRTPGARIVTIAFFALINIEKRHLKPAVSEAEDAQWFNLNDIPKLPLDHNKILETSLFKLKRQFRFEPLGYELLPEKFSLRRLQDLYESLYGIQLDNRNFRKKILKPGHLIKLNETQENVSHRKALLYKFDEQKYRDLRQKGVSIDVLPAGFSGY